MISQTTEYALRAIVVLAESGDQQMTTEQLSARTKVPLGYLAKVMQQLARRGLVTSRRGLHGGFRLLNDPESITMLDVVTVVQPMNRHKACPLNMGSGEHGSELCPLHHRLDSIVSLVEKELLKTTIATLLVEKKGDASLCADKSHVKMDKNCKRSL